MTAPIGHNQPPCAFNAIRIDIEDLEELAKGTFTGQPIATQEQADAVNQIRTARIGAEKALEEKRKAENEPFDKGKAAVQAIAKPLQAKLASIKVSESALLTAWNMAQDAKRQADAQAAIALADELHRAAQAKFAATDRADMEGREEAEQLLKDVDSAAKVAKRIDKAPSGLRTYYVATVTDHKTFLQWLMKNDALELRTYLDERAQKLCNASIRNMAGVLVSEKRRT
jgi:hypothetical protein